MITSVYEVYDIVKLVIKICQECGDNDISQQLEHAMRGGSTGLEIIGDIKGVFVTHMERLENVIDKKKLEDVIEFVDRAYGN